MKRIILSILISLFIFMGISAQKRNVRSAENLIEDGKLKEAKEQLDDALEHKRSKDWEKTYIVYGKLAQAAGLSDNEEFNNIFEKPFKVAYEYYNKAIEIDEKAKTQVNMQLPILSNAVINKGIRGFQDKDYDAALDAFEFSLEIGENEIFGGGADTSIMYNAGLAAYNSEKFDKAVKYFDDCKELGYGGSDLYLLLKNSYLMKNDSAGAVKTLQEAFEAFPENESVLIHLVNYYLTSNKNEQALEYLAYAKENDPDNATFYHAEGVLYDKSGQPEKALEAYLKAVELNPDYFDTQYNIGALLFNKGVEMNQEANEIKDNEEYKKAMEKANKQFEKALPYLEKAHELNENDVSTMETLKILYYRLKKMDKHEVMKQKLEEAKGS